MKGNMKKALALGLVGVTVASSMLVGCGSKKAAGNGTEFSWTVPMPDATSELDSWDDAPAVKQWLADDGTDVVFKWNEAPTSADSDFYATLLGTGEYTDVMAADLLPETVTQLYDEGIAIDLTDLVEENMPNYMKWVEAHPEYKNQIYKTVDGEQKILELYALNETAAEPWSSFTYRRDWIVKYGKNPQTGAAFTGGWTDEAKTEWSDDVVFPGGETYPKYISDWEWMFEIFETAIETENLTDGYAVQMLYNGYYNGMGDLVTSFGGSFPGYYETKDGEVKYGWTDDSAALYAYTECLNKWYEEGWLDPKFDERASDSVFFMIDQPGKFAGNVGMSLGLISQMGSALDTGENAATNGICYDIAPQPINDLYGDDSVKNVDPWRYFEYGSLLGGSVIITDKAEDKDMVSLMKSLDFLYAGEGACLVSFGLSDEQQAEVKDPFMTELGLDNGAYTTSKDDEGNTIYIVDPTVVKDDLGAVVNLNRFAVGLQINANVDRGYSAFKQAAIERATMYEGGGNVDYLTGSLSADDATARGQAENSANTKLSTAIPDFITGRETLNEANWNALIEELKSYNVDEFTKKLAELK